MTYSDAFGRQVRFGDEPPDPCSNSCGWDHFEPDPCSGAGGLVSLVPEGATIGPLPSIGSWGAALEPPPSISSRGVASEPPPSTSTSRMASDPSPPIHRSTAGTPQVTADPPAPAGPRGRPGSTVLADSLPSTWNGRGPYRDNKSSFTRSPQSTSAAISSSSSSSSLLVSSPRSRACCFCIAFFFASSLVFLSQPARARFAVARAGSFGSGTRLFLKNSPPG